MEHQAIADALKPLSPQEAREAINTRKIYVGEPGSASHRFALSIIEAKDKALEAERNERSLAISEEANSIARKALRNSRRANIIAVIAIILSLATAIGLAIFQWLTKG